MLRQTDSNTSHSSTAGRTTGKRRWFKASAPLLILALATGAGLLVWGAKANDREEAENSAPSPATPLPQHPVVIRRPAGPPLVATARTNFQGQPVFASCSSCHTTTKPNLDTRRTEDLDQFHQGLNYNHGNLTCLSCHNSTDYDSLRLADTRSVEFADSMTLCSQCHGPQRRDYDMGLHGGMNGHWDLTRGGRTRNTCINCHDPHAPAFPLVMPVLPPRDRVSVPKSSHPESHHP